MTDDPHVNPTKKKDMCDSECVIFDTVAFFFFFLVDEEFGQTAAIVPFSLLNKTTCLKM